MSNLKLIKDPGVIYDLFYVFSLYFNMDYHITHDLISGNSEADSKFFRKTVQDFSPFSDDLLLFFHLKKNGRGFITSCYFTPYKDAFADDYSFDFLLNKLSDYDQLIASLIDFYFPEMSSEEICKYKNSIVELGKLIDASDYEELIKRKLYSFFVNPEPVIRKLIYELMSKKVLLEEYYKKNYASFLDVQNDLSFDSLKNDLSSFYKIEFLEKECGDIFVSVCLINKNCFNLMYCKETPVLLLGCDYKESIISYNAQKELPSLKEFGDVLTEQNRIDILDLMLERKEITIKDLERLLSFTGSTAYYHLTMMMRIRMVKTRNQGRTVLYSINEKYFELIVDILSRYFKKGG